MAILAKSENLESSISKLSVFSKLMRSKSDIIEIIVAMSSVYLLSDSLNTAIDAGYSNTIYLITLTAIISLFASVIFIRRNSRCAVLRIFDEKINVDFTRCVINHGYYATHIFLVSYSLEYFILPDYLHFTGFDPINGMYLLVSAITAFVSVNLLGHILEKQKISESDQKIIINIYGLLVLIVLAKFPKELESIVRFAFGTPVIISTYVLLHNLTGMDVVNNETVTAGNRSALN